MLVTVSAVDLIQIKVCIVGETETGKTSLHKFLVKKPFKRKYLPTVGADFSFTERVSKSGRTYRLAIWDLSGDEKFRPSHGTYYQGISVLILVFDLTRIETLYALKQWLISIEKSYPINFPLILVGNKKDLVSLSSVAVTDNDVRNLVIEYKETRNPDVIVNYFKTSAKTGENVEEMFTHIIETLEYGDSDNQLNINNQQ